MRIAEVSPLFERVPPTEYGGTERVVSHLTEELVRLGHEVTLFATADSVTAARLVPCCAQPLRRNPGSYDWIPQHLLQVEAVYRQAARFDIIHFHTDYLHFPLSRALGRPQVTTLHGRLDLPDLVPLFREFRDMPVVSISDAQRAPLSSAHWAGTVHHGLPVDLFTFHERAEPYLAFVGRLTPEKRVDRAIEIARRAGLPLRVAAKIEPDPNEAEMRALMSEPGVEYLGEIGDAEKDALMGSARALLFPIDWPEPFGLVMIEALACGTPVVAWDHGSVREILEPGRTAFIVRSMDEAVDAVRHVETLSRRECRTAFETRFSVGRMAQDYLRVFERLVAPGPPSPRPERGALAGEPR